MKWLVLLCASVIVLAACRWQDSTPRPIPSLGDNGGAGTGDAAQCSGDFPDWISPNPPPPGTATFELAQAYPMGDPVFATEPDGTVRVTQWNPPAPNTDAPWRSITSLSDSANRTAYLNILKNYVLENMSDPGIDFNAVKNNEPLSGHRRWFNVPMMTAVGNKRRDPYHGVTAEKSVKAADQKWMKSTASNLKSVAIGYYNELGGYTIGQVFPSYDLSKTDAKQAHFIDGSVVFKLLFVEYNAGSLAPNTNVLLHSPSWQVQDTYNPSNPPYEVRLLQVDVAVKDDHFGSTAGWIFATFVYDESLANSEPNAWRRLTPVGIMWGDDPTVAGDVKTSTLAESFFNPNLPTIFTGHVGRAGRLVGPVDNSESSCISCHGTAQVDPGNLTHYEPAGMTLPATSQEGPTSCTDAQALMWFRNLASGPTSTDVFGVQPNFGCTVNHPGSATLISTDYSLQIQEALNFVFTSEMPLGTIAPNPCFDSAKQYHDQNGDPESSARMMMMRRALELKRPMPAFFNTLQKQSGKKLLRTGAKLIGPAPDDQHIR